METLKGNVCEQEHQGTCAPELYNSSLHVLDNEKGQSVGAPARCTGAPVQHNTLNTGKLTLSKAPTVFQHPFTMTVSGPTGSGKTWLIKEVLRQNKITPKPQRIIVLYKRWQPLYDEIKQMITPVEFIQGIPSNLDDDDFFDVTKHNLILLDDLTSITANDSRIADLFTEGSHHRNLSVINLTQTLFPPGKNSATQRRNTQYMIIFKSPMSQDQVRTLGTFMFPGQLKDFLCLSYKATHKPHGYLVIDAKQNTPEHERFKSNIFEPSNTLPSTPGISKSIKDGVQLPSIHSVTDNQGVHIYSDVPESIKDDNESTPSHSFIDSQSDHISDIKMSSCDDCGIMFENVHDLQRHVKNWCVDIQPAKKAKLEEPEVNVVKEFTTEPETPIFQMFMEIASQDNEDDLHHKIEKYEEQGLDEEDAEDKALFKLRPANLKSFLEYYTVYKKYVQAQRGSHS